MVREILKLKSSWEFLQETELPVILYGTGNGADKIIDELERLGVKLYGVTASDGFVRKRQFRGFEVKALSDFESELEDFLAVNGLFSAADEAPQLVININVGEIVSPEYHLRVEIVGDAGDVGIVNGILMLPVKPADENEYQGEEDHSRYIYSKRLNGVIRVHIAICKDEYCSRCYDKSRGKWIIEFRVTHLRVSSS